MSRPLRICYPGAFYHVMNRGLSRNRIFVDGDGDRRLFKAIVGEAVDRWKIRVHAYALMSNHYHMLVETPLANISRVMRHIDGIYTQKFNFRHNRDGPLLRGRFKSILVQRESYFLELVRYIHLNGVKAKLYSTPEADPNCSHGDYILPKQAPPWLEQSLVLSHFAGTELQSRDALHRFVLEGIPQELEQLLSRRRWPAILGVKSFVASIRERYLKGQSGDIDVPQKNHLLKTKAVAAQVVLAMIAEAYSYHYPNGMEAASLKREMRWAIIYFLRRYAFRTFPEISAIIKAKSYKAVEKYLVRNNFASTPIVSRLEKEFVEKMSDVGT